MKFVTKEDLIPTRPNELSVICLQKGLFLYVLRKLSYWVAKHRGILQPKTDVFN